MAVTVSRQAGSGTADFNQGFQRASSLVYNVNGLDVRALAMLLANGTSVPGLPNYGDAHPEMPGSGMVARSFRVSESATGYNADVTVGFSTSNVSGGGLLYAVPDLTGDKFVWEMTFQDVEVIVPVAYRVAHKVADGSASGKVVKYWEVKPEPVRESRVVIQARWQIGTLNGTTFTTATRVAFEDEHDTVHEIGGYDYLFRVAAITPRDNNTYEIGCSWTRDRGTPVPDPGDYVSVPDSVRTIGVELAWKSGHEPPAGLIRKPFFYLGTVPSENPGSDDADLSAPLGVQFRQHNRGDIGNLPELPF